MSSAVDRGLAAAWELSGGRRRRHRPRGLGRLGGRSTPRRSPARPSTRGPMPSSSGCPGRWTSCGSSGWRTRSSTRPNAGPTSGAGGALRPLPAAARAGRARWTSTTWPRPACSTPSELAETRAGLRPGPAPRSPPTTSRSADLVGRRRRSPGPRPASWPPCSAGINAGRVEDMSAATLTPQLADRGPPRRGLLAGAAGAAGRRRPRRARLRLVRRRHPAPGRRARSQALRDAGRRRSRRR